MSAKGYSERDERRILDVLGRGLLKEFPNPERTGCPGSDVLKKIASREMPLPQADKWLDHLGSCSPCYRDFLQFQAANRARRKRTLLAIAASILIVASLVGWVLVRQQKQQPLVAQTAVLDLRNRSVPRGTEPDPDEPPLELNRAATSWNIYLPLGSSEGFYDVQLVTSSGRSLLAVSNTARVENGITSLQVVADLSSATPGRYTLQIRRSGLEWSTYVLAIR